MDETTRLRYARHLVDAEGVTPAEARDFLSVLSRGLDDGAPEARELLATLDARLAMADGFRAAAEATARLGESERATDRSVAALVHLSQASTSRATPSRVRALQDYAARHLGEGQPS